MMPTLTPRKPPGSSLGNVIAFARNPLAYLERVAPLGDVVHVPDPRGPLYLVSAPDLIEQILVKQHHAFIKDKFTRVLIDSLGNGLLTSEGELWRRQRRLIQPAFHHDRIRSYASLMAAEARRMLDGWPQDAERDVHVDLMQLTAEIVARALFSAAVGGDAALVQRSIAVMMARYRGVAGTGIPLPLAIPTPGNLRFSAAVRRMDALLYGVIEERRRSGDERADLLGMLLSARDEDEHAMSDRQLRDEMVTLFVAGHETTALTLGFALYLLAGDADAQRWLAEELEATLHGRAPTLDDVPALVRTAGVIKESMRLYPPAWAIGREALEDVEIGAYRLESGAQIAISQWAIHRDPRHFDEPLRFEPARWLGDLEARLPRFAYMPFGGGPRICIGNTFAQTEATIVLASIAARFRFKRAPRYRLRLEPSVTLRPRGGIRLRVAARA